MSTIVYRDGVMAADSRAYSGNTAPIGNKRKITRLADGSLVGVSTTQPGTSERIAQWLDELTECNPLAFQDWAQAPAIPDIGSFTALTVRPDGTALLFENSLFPSIVTAPYYAIGSGREYALGALVGGSSALQALRVAVELDVWSGLPIVTLKHNGESTEFAR